MLTPCTWRAAISFFFFGRHLNLHKECLSIIRQSSLIERKLSGSYFVFLVLFFSLIQLITLLLLQKCKLVFNWSFLLTIYHSLFSSTHYFLETQTKIRWLVFSHAFPRYPKNTVKIHGSSLNKWRYIFKVEHTHWITKNSSKKKKRKKLKFQKAIC